MWAETTPSHPFIAPSLMCWVVEWGHSRPRLILRGLEGGAWLEILLFAVLGLSGEDLEGVLMGRREGGDNCRSPSRFL